MSDETNSEVKVEAAAEVAAEVETKVETNPIAEFFDTFEETPVKPVEPEQPELSAEPASEESFEYEGHRVRLNASREFFVEKDGQCLGISGPDAEKAAKDAIDERVKESEKGE